MDTLWDSFNNLFVRGFWSALVVAAVVVTLAWVVIRLLRRAAESVVRRGKMDATNLTFSRRVFNAIIIVVAVLIISMQVKSLQNLSKSLLASSGVVAVIVGFAAQQAMANIVGGFFLSIFRPFAIGDRIRIVGQDVNGVVEDISLRHTVVRNFDNNRVIVPNSVMNSSILENAQYHDGKNAKPLDIRVDGEADVERAMEIVAEEALAHPNFHDNRSEQEIADGAPPLVVRLVQFDETGATLRTVLWAKDEGAGYVMRCDLLQSIRRRLVAEGIALPRVRRLVTMEEDGAPQA